MGAHQRLLKQSTRLSQMLDSLCFQLSVNVPDQNSLSLLQIITWRRQQQVSHEQFRQLYRGWLESKNIFDLFSARQISTFSKTQLLDSPQSDSYINILEANRALQLINTLYNQNYLTRRNKLKTQTKALQQIQQIFSYLDSQGVIHLRMSALIFLTAGILISQNYTMGLNYEGFKVHLKQTLKDACAIDGMVSLRWFKNYMLGHVHRGTICKHLLTVLKEIQKFCLLFVNNTNKLDKHQGLPNIINEAFSRWNNSTRFFTQPKKAENYRRLFQQNQYLFFLDIIEDHPQPISHMHFLQKYGDQFTRCFEIDTPLLQQFSDLVRSILNEYISVFNKVSAVFSKTNSNPNSHKKKYSQTNNQKLSTKTSTKQRTPKKSNHNYNHNDPQNRRNVTPTHRNDKYSPLVKRQFGSAEKIQGITNSTEKIAFRNPKPQRQTTPTRLNTGYKAGYTGPNCIQVYRAAQKQGLQKDSFYQRLFFFRNKRVQSYAIVMKRLKGR